MSRDEIRYRALSARDPRFDGLFFVGVSSTGIYCRPICPARLPARKNCSFFESAALAEQAGYRACFRCRPELSPGSALVDRAQSLVDRAVLRINSGALNEGSVADLAAGLGVGDRHLRRAMSEQLGITPVELAQSRRLALAKQLLADTELSLTRIAHASGFGSVRRFNAAFQKQLRRSPSSVRRRAAAERGHSQRQSQTHSSDTSPGDPSMADTSLSLRLDYRPPFDFEQLLGFLRLRAIPGVEQVGPSSYARSVRVAGHLGTIRVEFLPTRSALSLTLSGSLLPVLLPVLSASRHLFDLDAQPDAINAVLAQDPTLAPLCEARPGLRVPGAFDGFEIGVRALLGQQISVKAATTLAGRLVTRFGHQFPSARIADSSQEPTNQEPKLGELTRLFPCAEDLSRVPLAELRSIGLPAQRAAAILGFSRSVAAGELDLGPGADTESAKRALLQLPGVGPWTAGYIAMRALGDPDALPDNDLVLKQALSFPRDNSATSRSLTAGPTISGAELRARSSAWRPWRAYAVLHLWVAHASAVDRARDPTAQDQLSPDRRARNRGKL